MNTKLKYIQDWQELAQEANWSVLKMAKKCGVSVRTLERYFVKELGKRPKAWLLEQRQARAIELLKDGASVKQTAGNFDYKHPSHLSNGFKKYWGHCPTSILSQ